MKDISQIVDEIKQIAELKTDDEVAQVLGFNKASGLTAHKSRGSIPYSKIITWCDKNNVSLDSLLFDIARFPSDEYTAIPLYDVKASEGDGVYVADEEERAIGELAFKTEWLHKELNVGKNGLRFITTQGDSMTPTLNPGDILLIDTNQKDAPVDGIYAIKLEGRLLVKRLQYLPGPCIQVSSDNQAYSVFNVRLSNSITAFEIVGRVVWAGKRF